MKLYFYNESSCNKTNKGYLFKPKTEKITGLKIKFEKNQLNKPIYINLNLNINIDSYLVVFKKNNIIEPIFKLSKNNKYIKKIKKTFTNEVEYLAIIYKKQNNEDFIIINNFEINYINKFLFDQVYYINLRERPERKIHILNELKKIGINSNIITPIDAFYYPLQPQIGCAISHMKALRDAYVKNYQNIIIFEDDFTFKINNLTNYLNILDNNLPNWDVIQFSTINCKTKPTNIPLINKVIKADTTAAYGLKRHMIIYLFNIFKTCINPNKSIKGNQFAIDVLWQTIQDKFNWYIFNPNIGYQNQKFESDIEKFRSVCSYN